LDKDGVLDLAESGLLNPDFAVKDLADKVTLLVPRNPRLVLITVAAVADKALLRCVSGLDEAALVVGEQLPGAQMTVMHTVQDNAHSLHGSEQGRDSHQETNNGKYSPATTDTAESNEDGGDKTSENAKDAKAASEDDTRAVAVADGPSDKIGVRLTTKGVLDWLDGGKEGGRVSSALKSVQSS